jgi:hypothetical protein
LAKNCSSKCSLRNQSQNLNRVCRLRLVFGPMPRDVQILRGIARFHLIDFVDHHLGSLREAQGPSVVTLLKSLPVLLPDVKYFKKVIGHRLAIPFCTLAGQLFNFLAELGEYGVQPEGRLLPDGSFL